jgi:hypothetical protein
MGAHFSLILPAPSSSLGAGRAIHRMYVVAWLINGLGRVLINAVAPNTGTCRNSAATLFLMAAALFDFDQISTRPESAKGLRLGYRLLQALEKTPCLRWTI